MISVTDLRPGIVFEDDGQMFKVLSYEHIKMGRGSANIKVKVKNLKTGTVTERSFISGARVSQPALVKKTYQYLYKDSDSAHVMDEETYEQRAIPLAKLGKEAAFLREGMSISLFVSENEPLALELPPKLEFVVAETGPDVRGNSATNIFKDAILENGLKVRVPLFIEAGDRILVDTRTGAYSERAKSEK